MKQCSKCKTMKSIDSYYTSGGYTRTSCIQCHSDSYKNNKNKKCISCETIISSRAVRCMPCQANSRKTVKNTLAYDIFHNAKQRATKLGVPFTIELSDVVIPELCPYLQIPLYSNKISLCDNSPTLDKIIPELGYIPNNVMVISHKANRMKSNATLQEIETFCTNALDIVQRYIPT